MCLPYQVGDTTAPFVRGRWPERVGIPGQVNKTGEPCGSPSGPPKNGGTQTEIAAARERCSYPMFTCFRDANPGRTFDVQRGEYRGGI
jgi:hypothetical protein